MIVPHRKIMFEPIDFIIKYVTLNCKTIIFISWFGQLCEVKSTCPYCLETHAQNKIVKPKNWFFKKQKKHLITKFFQIFYEWEI